MAFQSSLVIRYSAYVWNGVCGMSLLQLDDPDRLRATALLWQASAWRDELRQLLPWALPVPLRVHARYSRAEIEAAFGILTGDAPWIHREGILWHEPSPLLPLHPLPRPGPRPWAVPLGEPEHHHRSLPHRAGGVTEPFRCLGFARYVSHEGERILFVHQWRFAGGWSDRSRRGGYRGWGLAF